MRILSLHPVATEVLFALGAGNMLVGRCDTCEYPENARSVPSIGDAAQVTAETVAIFEPHLVLLGPGQETFASTLKFSTLVFAPTSLTDFMERLKSLANAIEKTVEADLLCHELMTFVERMASKVNGFHKVKVYLEQEHMYVLPSFLGSLIALAGGELYVGGRSIEELLAFNSHIIIVSGTDERLLELLISRDGWKDLQAISHERVFLVDEGLLRPTPRIAQGLSQLARILHGVELNHN